MEKSLHKLNRTIAQIRSMLFRAVNKSDIEAQSRLLGYLSYVQAEYIQELEKELYNKILLQRYRKEA